MNPPPGPNGIRIPGQGAPGWPRAPGPRLGPRPRGAVLITGLLVLTVMTILGLASMRGTILQERMAGNLKEQASAFQAAEAALQAALTAIEESPSPLALDAWGKGGLVDACKVSDLGDAQGCTYLKDLLSDWRSAPNPTWGVPITSLGGAWQGLAREPRVVAEVRYVAPLDLESASQGRGIYYYTVTALGIGQAGQSRAIVQSTIPRVFAW